MRARFGMVGFLALLVCGGAGAALAEGPEDERLHSCETSLQGVRTEINYVQDAAYFANVGRIEHRFSRFGKVSCPGYVTLREILRRNGMEDDGSYCVLWDRQGDTYVGAQVGHRRANAVCGASFCERVNTTKAAALQGGKAATAAGFEAVQQRPGAALLSVATGDMAGKIEGAGAVVSGLASSPVGVGAVLVGAAATGGALWYCAEGPEANSIADEPLPAPEPYVPRAEDFPEGTMLPSGAGQDDVVWSSTLPPMAEGEAARDTPVQDGPAVDVPVTDVAPAE
ncbi:hypothetical protein PE067_07325 [Paracoccus sp. DMF-8]|uniref:hypothetical protein n=1 Tax=Paracoccus sp. DMF-8 TaxID=3019445 RepID=UPI0023E7DFEA|nr:hypothetical protein [Paracoccus sp. DMF-8]MDF3605962.1 hypothetical protein [Paracoccus sp. DMF-8]